MFASVVFEMCGMCLGVCVRRFEVEQLSQAHC